MKKCYINPHIIVVPIRPRPIMVDTSNVGGGDDLDDDDTFAKGIYGSWEADDEDE